LYDYFRYDNLPDLWEITFRVSILETLCNQRLIFTYGGNIVTPLTLAQSAAAVSRHPNVDIANIAHPHTRRVQDMIDQSKASVKKVIRFYVNFYVKTLLQHSNIKFDQVKIQCNDIVILSDLVIHHVYTSLRHAVGRVINVSTDNRAYKVKLTNGSVVTRPAKFVILLAKHNFNEKTTYVDPFESISTEKILSYPIIDHTPSFYDTCDVKVHDVSDAKFPETCKCNFLEKEMDKEKEMEKEEEKVEKEKEKEEIEKKAENNIEKEKQKGDKPSEVRKSSRKTKQVDFGAVIQH
jgi:hypothetical protein